MSGVGEVFDEAAAAGRAALVGYLPAGFPSVGGAIAAATAMVGAGVDIVEIGLPYSDPLMDGPVIQEAVHRALTAGTRVADVLRTVAAVAATGAPVLVMTYWNPVDHYGVDAFARDLAGAGGVGVITPDLTPEEAGPWLAAARRHGLDPVFLVAPSSSTERIARVAAACGGFVYAASLMGVTGARETVNAAAEGLVARVRAHTRLPVAVGLGVRDGAQAARVARFADGVIVGSAFVQRLLAAADEAAGVSAVTGLAADLAAGVRAAGVAAGARTGWRADGQAGAAAGADGARAGLPGAAAGGPGAAAGGPGAAAGGPGAAAGGPGAARAGGRDDAPSARRSG